MTFQVFIHFVMREYLCSSCYCFKNIFFIDGNIYKLPFGQYLRFSMYAGFALSLDNIKENLRQTGSTLQFSLFIKSDQRLAKICSHLFVNDHVYGAIGPARYITVDISIGTD